MVSIVLFSQFMAKFDRLDLSTQLQLTCFTNSQLVNCTSLSLTILYEMKLSVEI